MPIKIKHQNNNYKCSTILWDRDSYFTDFNSYWTRLIAAIAQKIAENTTNNWNSFSEVRTRVIASLGLDIETQKAALSSPINLLPVNTYPPLLASCLCENKNRDELTNLFQMVTQKALNECKEYIKSSLITKNIEIIKRLGKNVKQFLITNDSKENNDFFITEANLENYFYKVLCQINKGQLDEYLKDDSLFLTSNTFLKESYLTRKIEKVILIEDISSLSFDFTTYNSLIKLHIDGASKGNPGPSGIGIVFYKEGEIIEEIEEFIGNQTNNFAEYTALIKALEISKNNSYKIIEICSDSELVVNQINKVYKVKDAYIKDLYDKACSLIEKLEYVKVSYVPREENLRADKLANNAIKRAQS